MFGQRKPSGPRSHRAYAIGDVHGRLDSLKALLDMIEDDVRRRRTRKTTLIFLGDLIDRGPDSAGVIDTLRSFRPAYAKAMFLMGNHEEVMLRVLKGDTGLLGQWLTFGGAECVRSYGVDPLALGKMRPAEAIALLRQTIPRRHVEFIANFADSISFGSYLFVHAGIRPGIGLGEQAQNDLRWIREPFLTDERDHGHVVVHGHTISATVEELPNRIGIDTGAYRTGVLTALGIEGTERWFLQTEDVMVETGDYGRLVGPGSAGEASESR
jgi:serine/threonine protein phosphatase 1